MATHRSSAAVLVASFAAFGTLGSNAWAAGEINQQVLQGVSVFNGQAALDMLFDAAPEQRPPDFEKFPIAGFANLSYCNRNATRGLYCLDGPVVRRWTDPEHGDADHPQEFSCANPALRLTGTDFCTAMVVAQNGDVWIAGRRKTVSVLIRLREKVGGSCVGVVNNSLRPEATERYCYQEFAPGRALLNKLVVVEGEEAAGFDRGNGVPAAGVLGLDGRNAVTYASMNPLDAPIDLVTKNQWLLDPKEQLQDLTLLQTDSGTAIDPIDNHLLVTTSFGRVLSFQTDQGAPTPRTGEVFNAKSYATGTGALPCPRVGSLPPDRYSVAASNKAARVLVANRNVCQVVALEPAASGIRSGGLVNVVQGGDDLTLSTYASDALGYPPDGLTVMPGVVIDLADCEIGDVTPDGEDGCPVIVLPEPDVATGTSTILRFARVQRPTADSPSMAVAFKVENVPDCRYRLYFAAINGTTDPVCEAFDRRKIIVPDPVLFPALPGEQFLNVREMFPTDITDQFTGANVLPDQILISPQYRARKDQDLMFGLIVVIPEPNVVLVHTYDAFFTVGDLLGSTSPGDAGNLRCDPGLLPDEPTLADLLEFDVVTRASETYIAPGGVGGSADLAHVDTIINSGCGSTRGSGGTLSVFAYGAEVAHNPGIDASGQLYDPIVGPGGTLIPNGNDDDDVYARLVVKLFDDLGVLQKQIACQPNVDGPGSFPLTSCGGLNTSYDVTWDKLDKCIRATQQPKISLLDQNCRSFEVQFGSYRAQVDGLGPNPAFDPANRIGEMQARLASFWLLYRDRALPSVPPGGFTPLPAN